jgi:hypothetical protein
MHTVLQAAAAGKFPALHENQKRALSEQDAFSFWWETGLPMDYRA